MPIPASTYRLERETLDHLDRVAAHLASLTGAPASRADAIRFAAREAARRLGGKKKPPQIRAKDIDMRHTGGIL